MSKIYNFSAGPAILPHEVLVHAKQELLNWNDGGTSVMEISHRSKEFDRCALEATQDLRDLLSIPNNYKILFCQGGARAQFAAVPLNILGNKQQATYINSGYWSHSAAKEATKYTHVVEHDICVQHDDKVSVKPMSDWPVLDESAYLHYCPNETIDGVAIFEPPHFADHIVVADFSSCILSEPIDVSRYGIIYAGAQKNIGPSGITIVIVRDDLLGLASSATPSVLDYQILANSDSMFNTPPTFAWYMSGLVFKWLKNLGGVEAIAKRNQAKAERLYQTIDQSGFYQNHIDPAVRSRMNVPFVSPNADLDKLFVEQAKAQGIIGIKGHRIVGGMRASLYNAMDLDGVNYLVDFMTDFERRYG